MNDKITASISLDLDNYWSYLKIHGSDDWRSYPSYMDIFVPTVLELLNDLNIKITFFIVGKDASLERNREYIQEIARQGHEIANHSFNHESWLDKYNKQQLHDELAKAEDAIADFTGMQTTGFRAPGFSWSYNLFEVLIERGYEYDASILPTFIGPLARTYYFWTSKLSKEERKTRENLFGSWRNVLYSNKLFYWENSNDQKLIEMPVTTMPLLRIPFHHSYLLYLYSISPKLMNVYFQYALFNCKQLSQPISFLLHPVDIIGGDLCDGMKFFPGMHIPTASKRELLMKTISEIKKHYDIKTMRQHMLTETSSNRIIQAHQF